MLVEGLGLSDEEIRLLAAAQARQLVAYIEQGSNKSDILKLIDRIKFLAERLTR